MFIPVINFDFSKRKKPESISGIYKSVIESLLSDGHRLIEVSLSSDYFWDNFEIFMAYKEIAFASVIFTEDFLRLEEMLIKKKFFRDHLHELKIFSPIFNSEIYDMADKKIFSYVPGLSCINDLENLEIEKFKSIKIFPTSFSGNIDKETFYNIMKAPFKELRSNTNKKPVLFTSPQNYFDYKISGTNSIASLVPKIEKIDLIVNEIKKRSPKIEIIASGIFEWNETGIIERLEALGVQHYAKRIEI